jgi:hypothetical protein
VNNQRTTNANINKLIEFRQAIYEHGMTARRDALFNVLDALLCEGSVSSFAMLSQSEQFQRKWPSLYAALADGRMNSEWLREYLAGQVPSQGVCVFPLDGSPWPRPRSRVLEERQYIYQASSDVNGGTVTVGYPYSLLEWCVEPHTSWSLPIDVRRVPADQTAQAIGAEQIRTLAKSRQTCLKALDIVAADGKYGNSGFLRSVKGYGVAFWYVCAVTGCCMPLHLRLCLTREDVPESMANALPSRNRKLGARLLKSSNWKRTTGARCVWSAGADCMRRKVRMCLMRSFVPVSTLERQQPPSKR